MKYAILFLALSNVCVPSTAQSQSNKNDNNKTNPMVIEIRSYNLKEGTRDKFHSLVLQTLPLLKRWNISVVSYGPSLHDANSYFLIRSFESVEDRTKKEDAFYNSQEWVEGPREAVLALIDNYTTIVIRGDEDIAKQLFAPSNR